MVTIVVLSSTNRGPLMTMKLSKNNNNNNDSLVSYSKSYTGRALSSTASCAGLQVTTVLCCVTQC